MIKNKNKILDSIIEEHLRRELAMTNIVVESKIKFYNNFFIQWYGKTYIGGTKADVLRQIPKIKELNKILERA
jgi:hypothetical protein|tara:strand:- start:60 stop:278 length:219 start_codon:yes stop_codon:yes gene_type:complete